MARIGKAGLLFHRQRVEFGAHQDRRAVAVLVDRDEAGLADLLGDLEAERAHLGGETGCGFHFLKRQLGMGVDVLVERIERRVVAGDRGLNRSLESGDIKLGAAPATAAWRRGQRMRAGV